MDETIKTGLLDLVEHAVEQGWSARRAAELLGLDHVRCGRWQARSASGELTDRAPGGHPLHGLLEHERAAILALFEAWGHIDRSHRKAGPSRIPVGAGACLGVHCAPGAGR